MSTSEIAIKIKDAERIKELARQLAFNLARHPLTEILAGQEGGVITQLRITKAKIESYLGPSDTPIKEIQAYETKDKRP